MRNVIFGCVLACLMGCRWPDAAILSEQVHEAGMPDVPHPTDAGASRSADASVDVSHVDAGTAGDARSAYVRRPVRAFQVDPATCDEDWVDVPADFVRPDEMRWHLCYRTPTEATSPSPLAGHAPEAVVFTQRNGWSDVPTDVIWVEATGGHPGWTASVVIAVPYAPDAYPLFNVRSLYDFDLLPQSLWALGPDQDVGHYLETHGTLAAWHILPDGSRVATDLHTVLNSCHDEMFPEVSNGGSFVPAGEACPDEYYLCAPGRYSCDYEP